MVSIINTNELHQNAQEYFQQRNYLQAASLYEELIEIEPDVKSHYWHLGLTLLLHGQEVEAQTTWLMAMMEDNPEQVGEFNTELINILQAEAECREKLAEYANAIIIRQNIKEILPQDIHNILNLINLTIQQATYIADNLQEWQVIEFLQSTSTAEINLELLATTLKNILNYDPLNEKTFDFVEACLPYFTDNLFELLSVILPAALNIAHSLRQGETAADLLLLYLRLDPHNIECLFHLSGFYQNSCNFEQGIKAAKTLYSLVETLPEKIIANRQILRGLMSAGGYWEESCTVNNHQQELIQSLLQTNPQDIPQIQLVRLYNANYFAPYVEDSPHKNRNTQNKLMQVCHDNILNYGRTQIEKYTQGHLERKKQNISNRKLKIGYISHCLRGHSVGWLTRWLIQYHDREKFQINSYFVNFIDANDWLHQWYINHVDNFYKTNNVWSMADQIYQDEIDILIDLDSITLDTTCEIVAMKPAPIQATWLGWDASGHPSVDYFIADPYVLPESAPEYYREKIWRLPNSYIAVDGFEVDVPTLRRDDLDIPHDAMVYLCAQRGFKRNPHLTRLQLKIIKEVPNSYFLIKGISEEESIRQFFHQIATEEGVDPSRLLFLPGVGTETIHRANLSIADVVLDTYPYNGATTTLETLWMGIPLVTRVGEQFAARNSYTMMVNAGITEGIAWTDAEYVEWGVRLGKDENLRQEVARKLKLSRQTSPLWNGKQFAREMEKAYEQMWQRYIEANSISS